MRSIVNQAGSGVVIWGSCGFHLAGGSTRWFQRDGMGVTSPLLRDSLATYTPGISERRGSATSFQHSGVKSTDARSNTSQAVAATRSYDAYGNVVSSSGTWAGPFGYGGGFGYPEDSATGLQLLGHRYYDSSTGRFLTRDPIKDGRNWYVYCDGDPVNGSDPTGLVAPALVGIVLVGGVVLAYAGLVKLAVWGSSIISRARKNRHDMDDDFGAGRQSGYEEGMREVERLNQEAGDVWKDNFKDQYIVGPIAKPLTGAAGAASGEAGEAGVTIAVEAGKAGMDWWEKIVKWWQDRGK